jgi:hypothetical protein
MTDGHLGDRKLEGDCADTVGGQGQVQTILSHVSRRALICQVGALRSDSWLFSNVVLRNNVHTCL